MSKDITLESYTDVVDFLWMAQHVGWINGSDFKEVHYFLEKPWKWQSEYEFMVKWTRYNLESDNIFLIYDEDKEDEFLADYEVWINGSGE
tara:strand:- start:1667 stop:1936 length:270 start_codon:yes stop_codon:yes gene_type:complete